jgi:UDP-N-acetylmuramate--alanine ligase
MSTSYFFCGIGGSGMMPLAMIIAGRGGTVAGSDRSLDQGRIADKFAALEAMGIGLFPQDGSGPKAGDIFIASAAIEDTVPDVAAAIRLGLKRMSRAELLAELFNASEISIAVGGTSGKSTVTGMIGWILDQAGHDPTIMNGAVMKNYATPDAPFASARVGKGEVFVSEVDESDGTIALYNPTVAVVNNVTLDHKSMEELRELFDDFVGRSGNAVINYDDPEARELSVHGLTFGIERGRVRASEIIEMPDGVHFKVVNSVTREEASVALLLPGRHNVLNALAAICASSLIGVSLKDAAAALASFAGLKRRFERVGEAGGVTVIDDFGHNPDKIAATLSTLTAFSGRLLIFFQPHGYGPLRLMGEELAQTFAGFQNGAKHELVLCDPVYFGGTVDRSRGSDWLAERVTALGGRAHHIAERAACGDWLVENAQPGDRIIVMGARDDTLSVFAQGVLDRLSP